MKLNAVKNKEGGCVLSVSGQFVVAQARSALLASSRCYLYSVSWRPLSLFGLWIILFIPLPPSLLPFYFSSHKSVSQVPGPICVGAHGWKARFYQGLACSSRSVSRVWCSDDEERVKSYTEETRGKKTRWEWGEFPPFSSFSPVFFFRSSIFRLRSTIWMPGTHLH